MSISLNGLEIDYDESGTGPTLVLVPGSFSTGAAWRPVTKRLNGMFRIVTTSLPGYGGTREVRDGSKPDIDLLAEVVEEVVRTTGSAVHLVGHSFGGCVAVAVATRGLVKLSGLTLFEANPVDVLRMSDERELHCAVRGMLDAYEAAADDGMGAVAARVIDFWGGAGSFDALPEAVRGYVAATAATNALDWRTALGFNADAAAYRAIDCRARFVFGSEGHKAAKCMAEVLGNLVPNGKVTEMSGASHFMLATHPEQTAAIIMADMA